MSGPLNTDPENLVISVVSFEDATATRNMLQGNSFERKRAVVNQKKVIACSGTNPFCPVEFIAM